ncbi:type II restriction enzyme [Veillonella tobetsuensis]|uniref:Type II restriction endonuclease n=1 Tax=Veillonella tobetsuensis TaxID=1110546 RepID=A0A2S7ZRK1_9FIRM|nr:type II restriction endonuclease [Veillonella tobetsuensis]PQL25777.1 type II restriction endonuclease [Veillonella tobetsuensis]
MSNKSITANDAWAMLIEKYDIVNKVIKDGLFHIKASEIKAFKEPRLMAKWDCIAALPTVLKKYNLNILPDSRSSYVLGDFLLYKEIPELQEEVFNMDYVEIPDYETIDINNISSEAVAINVLVISGILDDFLGVDGTVQTFSGRMGTGEFDFVVDTVRGNKQKIFVKNAQCEIDGGFENEHEVVIMEAKNILNEEFHVRQLYFPYRLWRNKVTKPVRLIFSIYSNMIFRLFEYRFVEINDYSSIELIKTKNYSLQDTTIDIEDLIEVRNNTKICYQDNQYDDLKVPFIQANSFERVISLLENMKDNPMTKEQIAALMVFDERQSDYYYNAGAYLGLFEKKREDKISKVFLTRLGDNVFSLNYKERQLKFVELILKHQIFADCFDMVINSGGDLPDIETIESLMREYNVCNEGQINRRASSVQGWIKWIFNLINL